MHNPPKVDLRQFESGPAYHTSLRCVKARMRGKYAGKGGENTEDEADGKPADC